MNEEQAEQLKNDANIGDQIKYNVLTNHIEIGKEELESIEGYIAKIGLFFLTTSKEPLNSEIGFFNSIVGKYEKHRYAAIRSDYELAQSE